MIWESCLINRKGKFVDIMKEKSRATALKIAEDIIKLTEHKNVEEVGEHLKEFMINNHESADLIGRLMDEERMEALEVSVKSRDKEHDIEKMVSHLNTLKVRKRGRIRHYIITSTIAAAIFIASLFIFQDSHTNSEEMVVQNVKIESPLLIRESGEELIVDTKENKIVAAEFNETNNVDEVVTKNRLVIPRMRQFTVILSDSTEVTLNAHSELEYPSKFTGDSREVRIKGEAFFKVTKSTIPFVVKVGEGEVKVYGTSFNVKERENKDIETVLTSGSVGIKYQNGDEVMIKPNQRIVINAKNHTVENVDAAQYTGWLTNSFQYYNTEALTVIEDIEKWYGIKIVNGSNKIGSHEKISFNVNRDYSIARIMTLLEGALGIVIINEGGGTYRVK